MDRLRDQAMADMDVILNLIDKTTASLDRAPAGTLKITRKNGETGYARRLPYETGKPQRISKNNEELIKALAQKEYDMRVLKNLIARKMALEKFKACYPEESLESIYENLPGEIKALVVPVIPTDLQYAALWQGAEYTGRGFDEADKSCFFTGKGERVRSESEAAAADFLLSRGIPYKYECPLTLSGRTVYPAFTLLDTNSRRTLFLELFNLAGSPESCESFLEKLDFYQSAGIFPKDRLIMTFERAGRPLDTDTLSQLLKHYLQGF